MKNNRGFTVVELIVSIALLALILVPVAGFFTNSFRVQTRTSMKTSITRVSQYIMENLKNKNYLCDESFPENEKLKNGTGSFKDFVEGITLSATGEGDELKYNFSDPSKLSFEDGKINYKGIDYSVDISITNFNTSDMSNFEIPNKAEVTMVSIDSTGTFNQDYSDIKIIKSASDYNGLGNHSFGVDVGTDAKVKNPIDNKEYSTTYPTIVLRNDYPISADGTAILWLGNSYGTGSNWKKIRIIKEFKEELQVYIEGYNLSILKGQEGDGASSAQTRITSSYIGEKVEDKKNSESELWLDAKMVITNENDDSVRDIFEFSFPVNYEF